MMPIRRDLRFHLGVEDVVDWHVDGPEATHLLNALSVFLPVGERFFINAVRHYRDQITDAELKKAVTAFIGQEAMHGREHEELNRALAEAGFPVEKLEAQVDALLNFLKARLPASMQLSATIALEHITATFADFALRHQSENIGKNPKMPALWHWHALEETEHKGVAYDVWEQIMGRTLKAYAMRTSGLALATALLIPLMLHYQAQFARADKRTGGKRDRIALARYLFTKPGMFTKLAWPWLDYFKPGFHPWDHDNRELLTRIDSLVSETEQFALAA